MEKIHPTMQRVFQRTELEPTALANAINISPQNITNWSKRGVSKAGALQIAKKFDISVDWILTGEEDTKPSTSELMQKIKNIESRNDSAPTDTEYVTMSSTMTQVPIISWVAAGSWSNIEPVTLEDALGFAPKPINLSVKGFGLKVRGQSMLPEFKPGDVIYVEPQTGLLALKDSDLVVVQCNGDTEATFKQLVIGETSKDMYLKPLNPNWHEQKMVPIGECHLVGKVVGKYVEY